MCIDARTPKEYEDGHIPDAYNLPLFSNQERITVGTLYKQKGRAEAMINGMNIVRPKFHSFLEKANELMIKHYTNKKNKSSSNSFATSSNKNNNNTSTYNNNHNNMTTITTPTYRTIIVYCWRGGMRSHALAYLLANRGDYDQVIVLSGGYRAFRKWSRLVYCYLPVNATYNFVTRSQNNETGKIDYDLQRNKPRSIKKKLKRLEKLES